MKLVSSRPDSREHPLVRASAHDNKYYPTSSTSWPVVVIEVGG